MLDTSDMEAHEPLNRQLIANNRNNTILADLSLPFICIQPKLSEKFSWVLLPSTASSNRKKKLLTTSTPSHIYLQLLGLWRTGSD